MTGRAHRQTGVQAMGKRRTHLLMIFSPTGKADKLRNWRRVATRYDKSKGSYLGFVSLASAWRWLHLVRETQARIDRLDRCFGDLNEETERLYAVL
ncbi:hypothetical protein [Sphingobium sp. Sx8-8]|uniref:hypothetical protein n=1 Tax=Sphingobium sp. Sx8-8 TaxID=2933617 RepID=UPI001F592A92|nr:hypothetical protein [Sphingobium sp. Sx8-8]